MIDYKKLKEGQQLKVLGPDETGRITRGITVTVSRVRNASVTVKDAAGREWNFHYQHGAAQLEAVVETTKQQEPPALRQDGPTLKEWLAKGYKAEAYPPQGYAAKPEPNSAAN
jgi:hypothetical protein